MLFSRPTGTTVTLLESAASFVRCLHDPGPGRPHLLQLHLELGAEPSVLARQPPRLFEALPQRLLAEHPVGDVLTGPEHADRPSVGHGDPASPLMPAQPPIGKHHPVVLDIGLALQIAALHGLLERGPVIRVHEL